MKALITLDYQGMDVTASRDAWFNATEMAVMFGKRPVDWLRLPETARYIDALCKREAKKNGKAEVKKSHFVKSRKGGNDLSQQGTWLHPKLAVVFARWCDVNFAIWCDEQITELLSDGQTWQQHRQELASVTKLKNRLLHDKRQAEGKETQGHHYSNEALLENEALTGRRQKLKRDALNRQQLKALDDLIAENAALIAQGLPYETRKQKLFAMAAPIRAGFQAGLVGGAA